MRIFPVVCIWRKVDVIDDDGVATRRMAMVPRNNHASLAARQYHELEEYPLVPIEPRSRASHSQFFAAIHEGFQNLPESIAARWPTPEHLRKWCLIECGWFDEDEFDFESAKEAQRLARWIRTDNEYARIRVVGMKVIVRRPKSQSAAAMGKDDFQASKQAVLELLDRMVGVPRGELKRQAGRSG